LDRQMFTGWNLVGSGGNGSHAGHLAEDLSR
jgi:hypothetical protein